MEFASVWQGNTEIGTVTFEGQQFSASGAHIAPDHSLVCGYVTRDEVTGRYGLTAYNGDFMFVELTPRGKWPTPRSYMSSHMMAWQATINGRTYTGRNGGPGLFLALRASNRKAKA